MLQALREFGFTTHQLSPEYVVGQRIFAIGTPAGKRAVGRTRDLADIEALGG